MLCAEKVSFYTEKNGHIVYEWRKYYTKSHYEVSNGIERSYVERLYYPIKEIHFYWKDFGNEAYEVAYRVAQLGGKRLPKKKLIYEKYYHDTGVYYLKAGAVYATKDPWRLKHNCINANGMCEMIGWYEMFYPNAKKYGSETIAGKKAVCYREDAYTDMCLWHYLILVQRFYATSRSKRTTLEDEKIAVKVETGKSADFERFRTERFFR
jgi:hypothetical protein